MDRARFRSLWNGIALIIFFAGIFLGVGNIRGVGTGGIAIFMWIIGGTVETIIYGEKPKKKAESVVIGPNQITCPSCGQSNIKEADFCIECGTALQPSSPATDLKKGM